MGCTLSDSFYPGDKISSFLLSSTYFELAFSLLAFILLTLLFFNNLYCISKRLLPLALSFLLMLKFHNLIVSVMRAFLIL